MDIRVIHILDYIESHLSDALSLKYLAHKAHLSPSQFHRVFKKETGKSPFQFIEEIRLAKALELVTISQIEVQEIAHQLGYKNYETFSRAFKKQHVLSPDDLRSIIAKIKNINIHIESDQIFLSAVDSSEEPDLLDMARKLMADNQIPKEALKEAKIFRITPKPSDTDIDGILIKNKFELTEDRKIWESLLSVES